MNQNKFTGVHNYLDKRFEDQSPSDAEIKQAKKEYWKIYNTELKQRIRKEHPNLWLRFSKKEMQLIKEKLDEKELLSAQVRRIVLNYINGTNTNGNIALVEQQLFLVSAYLEELLEQGDAVPLSKIDRLQQSIVAVQDALEQG